MLVKYEFIKHINKFNILLASVMLIFNIGITAYQYRNEFTGEAKAIRKVRQNTVELYVRDKAKYDKIYEAYLGRLSEYNAQVYAALANDAKSMPVFENDLLDYPDYGDIRLFSDVDGIVNAPSNYRAAINSLLRDTATRIKAADNRDSYTYKYYIKLINEYDPMANKSWDITIISGWNEFFSLQTSSVFLALASVGLFCGVFTVDRRAGFTNVLNISKKGRREVTKSKLVYTASVSIPLTVMFTLTPLNIFAVTTGLSSPDAPVQALDGFTYCQYDFSIWQYLIIYIIVRIIVFLCLAYIIAVIGQYAQNEIPAFVFVIILAAAGFMIKNINPGSIYYSFRKFNAIDIANVNILFDQLNGINIFNEFADYTYFMITALIFITVAVAALSILKRPSRTVDILKENKTSKSKKPYLSMSILAAENYKLLLCEGGIYIFIAAVILKYITSGVYFRPADNPLESIYMNYMAQLKGPVTDEKLSYIEQEYDYIYDILDKYSDMRESFQNGAITYKEYQTYLGQYNYANYCKNACDRMCERRDYLLGINESHPNIEFIYEEGMERLLGAPIDITALMAAIFICGNMFAIEYNTGFCSILRLAKKGRGVTFRNKIAVTLIASIIVYIIFGAIDIYNLHKYYDINYLNANIMSMPRFSELNIDIGILSYAVIYKAISLVGYVICFLFITALSGLLKNQIKTIIFSSLVIFIPYIAEHYGMNIFRFLSIPYFISPQDIRWGIISCVCCTAITIVISTITYCKWGGTKSGTKLLYKNMPAG